MTLELLHIDEPNLLFGHGQKLAYPRDGLYLFGPGRDETSIASMSFGAIGTRKGIEHFRSWMDAVRGFIESPQPSKRGAEPQHIPFPGFEQVFGCKWPARPLKTIDDVRDDDIARALRIGNRYEAVKATVDIYAERLVKEELRLEDKPRFWFVIIPEEIYRLGRPQSRVARAERTQGTVTVTQAKARSLKERPVLFEEWSEGADVYDYHPDFRRQLKARLLQHQIVTQIVRETTLAPEAFRRENGMPLRKVEDKATIAWKLGTGAFYKAGGRPWQLADVRPRVCYVGLVYKRMPNEDQRFACCAAQMFLTNGDGVVFRGALGPWYSPDLRQFHLDRNAACDLIKMVVAEYVAAHDEAPAELFIHAKSRFTEDEWEGFKQACPPSTALSGIQIRSAHGEMKLFRPAAYPVMRGTCLKLNPHSAYLWTSGYVPRLDTYMGPETPNPIEVSVRRGDSDLDTVLGDVMGLTKINFNSCLFNDRLPVTIRFADAVGDVLVAAPQKGEPRLPFKFYI